jgi:hypothetical protein
MPGLALRGYGRAYMNGGGSPAWTRKEGKSESGGLNQKKKVEVNQLRDLLLIKH